MELLFEDSGSSSSNGSLSFFSLHKSIKDSLVHNPRPLFLQPRESFYLGTQSRLPTTTSTGRASISAPSRDHPDLSGAPMAVVGSRNGHTHNPNDEKASPTAAYSSALGLYLLILRRKHHHHRVDRPPANCRSRPLVQRATQAAARVAHAPLCWVIWVVFQLEDVDRRN